jgi:hypothetical protein
MAMRLLLIAAVLGGVLAASGGAAGAEPGKPVLAGWPIAFPSLGMYQMTFAVPALGEGKPPMKYSQTVVYEWTGGRFEVIEVTLARDPAFKEKFAAATVAKEKDPPKEVTVGKHKGWLWEKEAAAFNDVSGRLVVLLDADKVLILERKGMGLALTDVAAKFDLAKLAAVLAQPPRTDFTRTAETFRALKKGMAMEDVWAWAGQPDQDIGSGIHIYVYKLPDGGRVLIGTPDTKAVLYVKLETKDGKVEDLVK